jgi:hypothetical protein
LLLLWSLLLLLCPLLLLLWPLLLLLALLVGWPGASLRLGVRLQGLVQLVREGCDVALCRLPVAGVCDLGGEPRSEPFHDRSSLLLLFVRELAQAKAWAARRNSARSKPHRRVYFSILDISNVTISTLSTCSTNSTSKGSVVESVITIITVRTGGTSWLG